MLGFGLFVYYEGRSHELNLYHVIWPAIILSAMIADNLIRKIRLKLVSSTHMVFVSIIFSIFLISTTVLMLSSHIYFKRMIQSITYISHPNQLPERELEFIKANTLANSKCLLWMKNQASYYAEAKLSSPIMGPGIVETLLASDADLLNKQIEEVMPSCVILGIDSSEYNSYIIYNTLLKNYEVVKVNPEKTLLLLKPISSN